MNIFVREMHANAKALLIWCLGMVFLIYAGMLKYAGFAGAGSEVNNLFEQLPSAVKSILGLVSLDITTIAGFYAVFYLYFMLLAGVHAVMLGAVIVSKEERDKTVDFLYAKPVKRSAIITAKLVAVLINIIVLNIVTMLASIIFVNAYTEEGITAIILRLMLALFIFQIIFAAVGALTASVSPQSNKAASLSAGLLLTTFFVSVVVDLYSDIDFLKYITPFQYFPAAQIILTKHYPAPMLLLSALLVIIFLMLGYWFMERKDLHS